MGLREVLGSLGKGIADMGAAMFDAAEAHGRMPLPGSAQLQLPAGKVTIWYHESKKAPQRDGEMYFKRPSDLQVTVTPSAGGDPLEVTGPGFKGKGQKCSTRTGQSIDLHGTIQVPAAGEYTIVATGTLAADAVDPQILIGS